MRYLIASDIHGSAYYCEKMLERFEAEKADRLILLGDLLYHGPRNALPEGYDPQRVASLLNSIKEKVFCVRGNCEAEVDQLLLEFPVMADYALMELAGHTMFITHGHLFNESRLPAHSESDILLHGHTHVHALKQVGGMIYMNPGSISIPKSESRRGYMTMESGAFIWKTLEGKEDLRYELR